MKARRTASRTPLGRTHVWSKTVWMSSLPRPRRHETHSELALSILVSIPELCLVPLSVSCHARSKNSISKMTCPSFRAAEKSAESYRHDQRPACSDCENHAQKQVVVTSSVRQQVQRHSRHNIQTASPVSNWTVKHLLVAPKHSTPFHLPPTKYSMAGVYGMCSPVGGWLWVPLSDCNCRIFRRRVKV